MKLSKLLGAVAIAALLSTGACGDKKAEPAAMTAAQQAAVEHAPPPGKAMSPGAVNRVMTQRGFRPTSVKRRGTTYVVDAVGRTGNQVRMVVDGRAGQIKGLDVVRWAPGARRIAKGSRGTTFVNDAYEFGYTLPDSYLVEWIVYTPAQWEIYVPWIDYGEDYVIEDWSEVYYEEDIEEVSYDYWVEEYGEIETWSEESFYEEAWWDESVETYYEENTDAFEEDYGYAYAAEVFEEDYYASMESDEMVAEQAAEDEAEAMNTAEAEAAEADYDEGAYDTSNEEDGSYDDGAYDTSNEDDGSYDDGAYDTSNEDDGSYDDSGSEESSEDDGAYR